MFLLRVALIYSIAEFLNVVSAQQQLISADAQMAAVWGHNNNRYQLAHGNVKNKGGANLPTAKNMYFMSWNDTLGRMAQSFTNNCRFADCDTPECQPYGSNAFMSTNNQLNQTEAIKQSINAWWSEFGSNGISDVKNFKRSDAPSGHATQCAWSSTTQFGCGVSSCASMTLVVCVYSPAGNWLGAPIYEPGPNCQQDSDCTTYPGSKCQTWYGMCKAN